MKVTWTGLIDDFKGHIDSKHYARHIPGNGEEASVCQKPVLSNKGEAGLRTFMRLRTARSESGTERGTGD